MRVKISPQMGRNQGRLARSRFASMVTWWDSSWWGLDRGRGPQGGATRWLLGLQQQDGQQQLLRSDLHKPGWTLKVRVLRGAPHMESIYHSENGTNVPLRALSSIQTARTISTASRVGRTSESRPG